MTVYPQAGDAAGITIEEGESPDSFNSRSFYCPANAGRPVPTAVQWVPAWWTG